MPRTSNFKNNRPSRRQRTWRWLKTYGKQMAACIISLAAVAHALGQIIELVKTASKWA
jgi:hypothetical protein